LSAVEGGLTASGWVQCRIGSFDLQTEWEVEPGRVLVLFGPSGAGKTTTLRAIAGLVRPLRGHLEIGGRVVYDGASGVWQPTHKRRVGYLTQQCHLFPHLRVAGNVAYGLPDRKSAQATSQVRELLSAFQLEGLEERYPSELSGGQQQRVALARALATRPDMLLLDEPFASLDSELRRTVRRELRLVLERTPVPVILVTHDREEALVLGDSVQVIDAGRAVAQGTPLEVLGQPGQARVARLVGVENLFLLQVDSRNPRDGTMTCHGEGIRLEVPLDDVGDDATPEDSARFSNLTVGVRASDIILATSEPVGSSARNRLPGVVTMIEARPPGYTVTLDCGAPLRCHVTGAALEEIGVREGQHLWAVFKASSCFLVEES
jgi:molybdate transport system ATP-binding protein